jgi:hypothetical protein
MGGEISPRQEHYLRLYEENPGKTQPEVAELAGISRFTVSSWVANKPAFKDALATARARRSALKRREQSAALFVVEEVPEEPQEVLDPAIECWLGLFEELDDRFEAWKRLAEHGHEVSFDDLLQEVEENPAVRTRFFKIFRRTAIKAEDAYRRDVTSHRAKPADRLGYLKAHMPQTYGDKVEHRHSGRIQLQAGDESRVEQAKRGFLGRFQTRAARELPAAPAADIVEGEEIPS